MARHASLVMLIPAAGWQRQVSAVMGMEGPSTLGYFARWSSPDGRRSCVGGARVILDPIKTMARFLSVAGICMTRPHFHRYRGRRRTAITLINGVLIRGFLAGANRVFQPQNTTTRAGITQPLAPERSGSPTSFAPWDSLGFQGRNFVATGPDVDELTRLNGRPAREPIRLYVGLQTAATDDAGWRCC